MALESINPATGETLQRHEEATESVVARILADAARVFPEWREASFDARAQVLRRAAALLRERREPLARLMTAEMGKPVAQGRSEVDKCAWVCEYYSEAGSRFLADEPVPTDARRSLIAFQPLGPVLAVMPWNFPFWQVFRFAAPALMAGNVGLLKHASNVSGCALEIERVWHDAGLPAAAFRTLLVGSKRVGAIIDAPEVKAVTLTGSTPAGRDVASRAGHALKKTVLELGGSDPYLVLEDADLEAAAETCVGSRLVNSGQSCIAAKRFIVVEAVRARFETLFVERMRARRVGDPTLDQTDVGPLARRDLRDDAMEQVRRTVAAGARVVLGGDVPAGAGAFCTPTVLAGVTPGMPAFDEELFAPVAALVAARDEEDAVRLANQSRFGLGAAVFTRDLQRGERVARALEAGSCFVNSLVKSDPRLPFGGIKESGYGRELSSFGIREFVNVKTVYVA